MVSLKTSPGPALIRRLCRLQIPLEGTAPALVRALCRETRSDAGAVLWFDKDGEISNFYARDLPAPRKLVEWFRPDPKQRVVEMCADEFPNGRIDPAGATTPDCPHRRVCLKTGPASPPLHRMCCTVRRGGAAVASLVLYRPAAGRPFGSSERTVIRVAARYLSLNARIETVTETSGAMYRADGEKALLLCERDGSVTRASANGYCLLAQASGCPVNRKTVPEDLEQSGRQFIRQLLAESTRSRQIGGHGPSHAAALINAWGMFRSRLFFESEEPMGVLIERVDHLFVRLCEAMWGLDLSAQQWESLLLLAQGMSHEAIAAQMGISHNTVEYHIRHLYSKLGVHTRDEAIACVLAVGEASVTT
jgi:DNA-binding CsgD family transcriptional regulator